MAIASVASDAATELLMPDSEDEAIAAFGDGAEVVVVGGGTIVVPDWPISTMTDSMRPRRRASMPSFEGCRSSPPTSSCSSSARRCTTASTSTASRAVLSVRGARQ